MRFIHLFVLLFEWPGFASSSNMMELDGTRLVAQSAQKIHLRNHDWLIPAFHRPFCEQFHAGKMIYAKPGWSPHAAREKRVPPRNCSSSGLLIVLQVFFGALSTTSPVPSRSIENLEKAEISSTQQLTAKTIQTSQKLSRQEENVMKIWCELPLFQCG